jgi:hypothetical protein
MPRKGMDVRHPLNLFLLYSSTADTLSYLDPDTGGPSLKRTYQKASLIHHIKPCPIETIHSFIDQGGQV